MTEQAEPSIEPQTVVEPQTQAQTVAKMEEIEIDAPRVEIIVGSASDKDVMDGAAGARLEAGVHHQVRIMSTASPTSWPTTAPTRACAGCA